MHISIPQPCHEDWNSMSLCDKGRHCGACSKTVVDIDSLHPMEAIGILSQSNANVCANGTTKQWDLLNNMADIISGNKPDWKHAAAALIVTGSIAASEPLMAQTTMPLIGPAMFPQQEDYYKVIHITGTLTEMFTTIPITGADISVYVKGKLYVTSAITDSNGKYQFYLALNSLQHCEFDMVFHKVGFDDKRVEKIQPRPGSLSYPLQLFPNGDHDATVVSSKATVERMGGCVVVVEVVHPFSMERLWDFYISEPSFYFNR